MQTRGTQNPVGFTPRVGSIPTSGTISARLCRMTTMHGALPPKARNVAAVIGVVTFALVLLVALTR